MAKLDLRTEEYNLMTEASQLEVIELLEKRNWKKEGKESLTYSEFTNRWFNKYFIGVEIQEKDEDNFDMYQAKRREEDAFISNPRTYLFSGIEEFFIDVDQEYLIEEGQLEKELNRKKIEEEIKNDFKSIRKDLEKKNYKVDFYITKEGFYLE